MVCAEQRLSQVTLVVVRCLWILRIVVPSCCTWVDPKIPGIVKKKLFKVFVQVWNFSPLRSTPPTTWFNNPSTAHINGKAVKGRQRFGGDPWQHFRWRF